jgi:hypothetical protein
MSDMFEDAPITLKEMIAEAERELHLRLTVYPRSVAQGKMSQRQADRNIRLQQAIVAALREIEELS